MVTWLRRQFLKTAACAAGSLGLGHFSLPGPPDIPRGERPRQAPGVTVVNPRWRVPVSLIIDDSTCLVNLAHYGIPQFREVFPEQYQQPWRTLPREIPDAIARYWAARELTGVEQDGPLVTFSAPFAAPGFTVEVKEPIGSTPRLTSGREPVPLERVEGPLNLASGTWYPSEDGATFCFDLPEGETQLHLDA